MTETHLYAEPSSIESKYANEIIQVKQNDSNSDAALLANKIIRDSKASSENWKDQHNGSTSTQMSYENFMTTALSYLEQLNDAVQKQDVKIHSLNQSLPMLNAMLKGSEHSKVPEQSTITHIPEGGPSDIKPANKAPVDAAQNTINDVNKAQEDHSNLLFDKYKNMLTSANASKSKEKEYANLKLFMGSSIEKTQLNHSADQSQEKSDQLRLLIGQCVNEPVKQEPSIQDDVKDSVEKGVDSGSLESKFSVYKRRWSVPADVSPHKKLKADCTNVEQEILEDKHSPSSLLSERDFDIYSQNVNLDNSVNDDRKQRFLKTQEALKNSGLLEITMKMAQLINRQVKIDAEIEKLKLCTAKFLESVFNSYQNAHGHI